MPGPVAVLPLCPVACGSALARVHGELWAVVVVKATFALAHERSAWPVTADPIVEADEHLGGHPTSSVVAASDLALELPGAGVTLMGAAHAAPGTTRTAVRLAIFQGGAAVINKHLVVSGDATRDAPTPKAFTRMPIVYERAFGGPSVAENPAGVGSGRSGPLPNIVDPRDPERPAGFGPIARSWAPRVRAMRALDGAPREGAVVVLEKEPDFSMFHAAPTDQRLEILRGDEWIVVDGMHPVHPRVQTQLPFAHAEARFARADKPGPLTPVSLRADTMTIDAERMVASVVWRGHVVIESVDVAAQLRVYVGLELPGLPIRWPEAPKAAPPKDEIWPDLPDTTTERDVRAIRAALLAQAPPPVLADADDDLDATTEIGGAIARAVLPFDPAAPPAAAIAEPAEPMDRIATDTVSQLIPPGVVLPFAGAPAPPTPIAAPPPNLLISPPPVGPRIASAPMNVEVGPDASLATRIAARLAAKASLADLVFVGADLPGVDLATADLTGLDLSRANLAGASLAGARLVDARLEGADLAGARLDGADLTRADLARANLRGASLDGAVLERTNFTYARGDGARLVSARGANATFARGQWDAANFDDAELPEADFTGASLAGARFLAARLEGVRLVDVRAAKASFEGARLGACYATGASLPGASLKLVVAPGSSWEGSDLGGASLDGAALSGANLVRVTAPGAQLGHANLSGANLQRVVAPGASCVAADLRGADLRYARLAKASFEGANLRDVQASFADLGGARFVDADLSHADLRDATFDGADLTRARLDGADLRDVDLSGANLTGAQRHGTKLAGARLPKT